jgi:hypothetical protein
MSDLNLLKIRRNPGFQKMARSQNSLLKTQHWQEASITDKVWQSFLPGMEAFWQCSGSVGLGALGSGSAITCTDPDVDPAPFINKQKIEINQISIFCCFL